MFTIFSVVENILFNYSFFVGLDSQKLNNWSAKCPVCIESVSPVLKADGAIKLTFTPQSFTSNATLSVKLFTADLLALYNEKYGNGTSPVIEMKTSSVTKAVKKQNDLFMTQ